MTQGEGGKVWDVAVIGGGPAGMMAAARAAERGAKVILLEKNAGLGKKLLITGGGRCNVTNAEFDNRALLAKFKEAGSPRSGGTGEYLFSAFAQWSVRETLDFFHGRNMLTKVEPEQRVFPVSDKAESVWQVLVDYLAQGKVAVCTGAEVTGFKVEAKKIVAVRLKDKTEIKARSFILATGGKSHPETGSTGEGLGWLAELGHTVVEPSASLVPLKVGDAWVKRLQGVSLQNIKISLYQNGVKQASQLARKKGKILFTHFGVSGPTILNLSQEVSELLKYGEVTLALDLLPSLDQPAPDRELQKLFHEHGKKKFKNVLSEIIPPAIAPIIAELSAINLETDGSNITRDERLRLVKLVKSLPIHITGLLGEDKAIVTSGGVKLDEVNFKTMCSRLYPNLYLIGDVLNINRPSGGYSLQLCWTTGYVAGNNVGVTGK